MIRPLRGAGLVVLVASFAPAVDSLLAQQPGSGSSQKCAIDTNAVSGPWLSIAPSLSLTSATTSAQTYSASVEVGIGRAARDCDWHFERTLAEANGKYDQKQKDNAAPNITRHFDGYFADIYGSQGSGYYLSGTAQLLADNSLAVQLDQVYGLSLGRRISGRHWTWELNAGPAFVAQNFTTSDPSTSFMAPAAATSLTYTFTREDSPSGPGKPLLVLELTSRNVVGIGNNPALSNLHASAVAPTAWPWLTVRLAAWDDYVANAPVGFRKNYFVTALDLAIKLGKQPK